MYSAFDFAALPRSAPTLQNKSFRPSLLKSQNRQSCLSVIDWKWVTSVGLNVPSLLLSQRLAGCQWRATNISGQPSPLKSVTVPLKVQSCGPLMPAAGAWSVNVTGTGIVAGGVLGGGAGAGPTPGAAGTGGTGAGLRAGSETGPVGQLACSRSGFGPCRPTKVIDDPAGSAAMPMISSLDLGASAETTVVHAVPSKCTTSVWWRCTLAL